jgi:hypothetical protein
MMAYYGLDSVFVKEPRGGKIGGRVATFVNDEDGRMVPDLPLWSSSCGLSQTNHINRITVAKIAA